MSALTALTVAVGALIRSVRETHKLVNSRMDELLRLTSAASLAEGKLAGHAISEPSVDRLVAETTSLEKRTVPPSSD